MTAEFERPESTNAAQNLAMALFTGFIVAGSFIAKISVVACVLSSAYTAGRFTWTFTGDTPSATLVLSILFVSITAAVAEIAKSTQLVYWAALRSRNERQYKQAVRVTLAACILWSLVMSFGFLYYTLINPAVMVALALIHTCSITLPYMAIGAGRAYRPSYPTPIAYTSEKGIITEQPLEVAPPVIAKASQIEPRRQDWIWRGVIPAGEFTLLSGGAGLGKSLLAITFCARLSRGDAFPDGSSLTKPVNCLIVETEQSDQSTTIPDLIAADADRTRIDVVRSIDTTGEFSAESLDAIIRGQTGRVDFVVLSPFRFLIGDSQLNDLAIRQRVDPFIKYARTHAVTILAITHPPGDGKRMAAGSEAYKNITRQLLTVTPAQTNPDGTQIYRLMAGKPSLTARNNGFFYRIEDASTPDYDAKRLVWIDEAEMLAAPSEPPMTITGTRLETGRQSAEILRFPGRQQQFQSSSSRVQASDWLRELLRTGPMMLPEILGAAQEAGYHDSTIYKASNKIGVQSNRVNGRNVEWSLPSSADDGTDDGKEG